MKICIEIPIEFLKTEIQPQRTAAKPKQANRLRSVERHKPLMGYLTSWAWMIQDPMGYQVPNKLLDGSIKCYAYLQYALVSPFDSVLSTRLSSTEWLSRNFEGVHLLKLKNKAMQKLDIFQSIMEVSGKHIIYTDHDLTILGVTDGAR